MLQRTITTLLAWATLSACTQPTPPPGSSSSTESSDFAAHWLTPDLLILKRNVPEASLLVSADATLDEGKDADSTLPLHTTDMPAWAVQDYPHLAGFTAFKVPISTAEAKDLARQQLAVITPGTEGISYVQTGPLLDTLYTSGPDDADELTDLGATTNQDITRFRVWAPTASVVLTELYNDDKSLRDILTMSRDAATGSWSADTRDAPHGTWYRYRVTLYHPASQAIETLSVTDPYSLSLSTNSQYSQVVDLNHPDTQPEGWMTHKVPVVSHPEASVLYEAHIRDFSALDSSLDNPSWRGKYAAFSDTESVGVKHLKALQQAGLTHLHLLPAYDISTVNENPDKVIFPDDTVSKACLWVPEYPACEDDSLADLSVQQILERQDPMGSGAQELVAAIREQDPFNWGYDPYHYTVPEGSYAQNPEGLPRLREFRQMVQAVHQMGLRVVMDVVYNHTFEAGLSNKSVLDKLVPNYYHRLNPLSGAIERSTCCENTATERAMMGKLMTDSLVVWARDYKIDGFRFDLMGHQPKDLMLSSREAVRAVDPDTYFYGEGWNFGEVANNAQFVQASQMEMAGSEIGTFTDRLRDAVRGGSVSDSADTLRQTQGIGNGLLTAPNELQKSMPTEAINQEYALSMDQIRIGLAANLARFPLTNASGEALTGAEIDYAGAPAGYALDPADTINYVSKHDNQTLWDNNQYRLPFDTSAEDRVRYHILSLAYPLMAQGIPFVQMGSELLRSKSFTRDSFNFGDWFNRVDFSKQGNNYHKGLPPAETDQANWPVITRVLNGNQGRDQVSPLLIESASKRFMDLLTIRTSSPLFSLTTAEEVIQRVQFLNTGVQQQTGLIAMQIIDDGDLADRDPEVTRILVLFNNSPATQLFAVADADGYVLHPQLQNGADAVVKSARAENGLFSIPALTVAVFVRPQL